MPSGPVITDLNELKRDSWIFFPAHSFDEREFLLQYR